MASDKSIKEILYNISDAEFSGGVDEIEILRVESRLGVRVRGDYRDFLREFGSGAIGHMELIGLGGPTYLNLVEITESERVEMTPRLPMKLLPVMNNGGGDHYCIDTSSGDQPRVVLWRHDLLEDQLPEVVSSSFYEWILDRLEHI